MDWNPNVTDTDDQTLSFAGTTLTIEDGNNVDLSSLVDDADADPTNELNTSVALNGNSLEVTDAGGTLSADLSSLQGGDDLGNHVATQNINLGSNWLSGDGGNEGVFVSSDGDVGIGTNSPDELLDVDGTAIVTTLKVRSTTGVPLTAILAFDDNEIQIPNFRTNTILSGSTSAIKLIGGHIQLIGTGHNSPEPAGATVGTTIRFNNVTGKPIL